VTKIAAVRFSLRPPRSVTPSHPLQIATEQQTKSSVTCSKQTIGPLPNRYKIGNWRCGEHRHPERASRDDAPPPSQFLIAPSGILIGTPVIRILPIYLKTRLENFSNRHSSRNSAFRPRREVFSREPSNLLARSTRQLRVCSPRQIDASNEVRMCVLSI
jgi:hypothetical protein